MAKLYFSYAAMNAGKSTILLQASHNYRERGMNTMLLTAKLDDRVGEGQIGSRIGLEAAATVFDADSDMTALVTAEHARGKLACVMVDEAQFLTETQVWQLAAIADDMGIPVMCYGLRTDFQGNLFPKCAPSGAGRCASRDPHHLPLRAQGNHGGATGRERSGHP